MKIKGYENYEIFEDGRIVNKHGRVMKFAITNGYKRLELRNDGIGKNFSLHRLLALHFIPNPENKCSVDHENQDKLDNSLSNLRWYTMKEQCTNKGGQFKYPISKGGISKNNKHNYRYIWSEDRIPKSKGFKTLELAQAYQIEHLKTYNLQKV
tara:strand:+ start:347 stop:805 length:459 start_codon:yes stop_codon:yes gene_type:complete